MFAFPLTCGCSLWGRMAFFFFCNLLMLSLLSCFLMKTFSHCFFGLVFRVPLTVGIEACVWVSVIARDLRGFSLSSRPWRGTSPAFFLVSAQTQFKVSLPVGRRFLPFCPLK